MYKMYLTNAQFGYVHLYACSLHGLPNPIVEAADHERVPAEPKTQPMPNTRVRLLERLAERLFLSILKSREELGAGAALPKISTQLGFSDRHLDKS